MQQVHDENGLSSGPEQTKPEQKGETDSKFIRTPQKTLLPDCSMVQSMEPGMVQTTTVTPFNTEKLKTYSKDAVKGHFVCGLAATKSLQLPTNGLVSASLTASCDVIQPGLHPMNLEERTTITRNIGLPLDISTENNETKPSTSHAGDTAKSSGQEELKKPTKYLVKRSAKRARKPSKANTKCILRSLASADRGLQTNSKGMPEAPEPSEDMTGPGPKEQKRRKRKKRAKISVVDEYSRIRKHLRYLLRRISYELSLITAYSTEGWKGLSLEKLKPEKELERARSEILRRKLKIRDLFKHLDSLCSDGRLPESLFDSEGEIDSEDIFCSKCGSKDLSANNDIILCDGACDRGFHQYCLQPPLLKEEIPPDGESWLCPGCDCKDDCVDLVNEAQGMNLCITDSWKKVFPEAAGGHNQDPNFGLPSDDSDDNDYNPDGLEDNDEDKDSKNSSDESDFTSTSDELEVAPKTEPLSGLPSDESDDEDYDPDALPPDDISKQQSSSSDFSSDSEDLGAVLKDDGPPPESVLVSTSVPKDPKGKTCSFSKVLLTAMESTSDLDSSDPVPEKRGIERLDYKKLYDETYGNVASSSSDDDDWTDTTAPKKIRSRGGASSVSQNGNTSPRSGILSEKVKRNLEMKEHTPKRVASQKSKSVATLRGSPFKPGSSGKTVRSSTNRSLGEAVKQRLCESFEQNQYPDRTTKENLAEELQITFSQVSKWFENTRWHSNHRSPTTGKSSTAETDCPSQQQPEIVAGDSNCKETKNVQSPRSNVALRECCNGDSKEGGSVTPKTSKEPPKTPRTRKKKKKC